MRSGEALLMSLGLLLVDVRVRCVVSANLFFIFVIVIHFCYHRWVSIPFGVIAMIHLTKVRRSDKERSRTWVVRQRGRWPRTERGSRDRKVPPTASELEVVFMLPNESEEGKSVVKRRAVDGPALSEEGNAYLLARDVAKGAPASVNQERIDVFYYIGLWQYLDAERFSGLPVKGRDLRINAKILIRLTAHDALNQWECK